MKIIERIKAKTPAKDKFWGKVSTVLGTTCATVLALGLVANPIGITALTVGSIVFGGKALVHATRVEEEK